MYLVLGSKLWTLGSGLYRLWGLVLSGPALTCLVCLLHKKLGSVNDALGVLCSPRHQTLPRQVQDGLSRPVSGLWALGSELWTLVSGL